MLAAKPEDYGEEFQRALRYPLLGSPKLDGIRASVQGGELLSRSLKRIPNTGLQQLLGRSGLEGLDGELIVGPPTAEDVFNRTQSQVMTRLGGIDDANYYVFDNCHVIGAEFVSRLDIAMHTAAGQPRVKLIKHVILKDWNAVLAYEAKQVGLGYEGICLRDPHGLHKQGRSTLRELGLVAIKRFVDAEAIIIDTYEQEENTNEQKINELGRLKRSSHKAGKVGKDTLGGFTVRLLTDEWNNPRCHTFNVGTGRGLTAELRKDLWRKRKSLVGKVIKFKYQKVGTKDAPREPIFLGFRDRRDMEL
jgi:DNA ligase-1